MASISDCPELEWTMHCLHLKFQSTLHSVHNYTHLNSQLSTYSCSLPNFAQGIHSNSRSDTRDSTPAPQFCSPVIFSEYKLCSLSFTRHYHTAELLAYVSLVLTGFSGKLHAQDNRYSPLRFALGLLCHHTCKLYTVVPCYT